MKIIISGASGLIGKPLVKNLRKHGHEVIQLVRRAPLSNESQWNPATGQIDASIIDGADAVIQSGKKSGIENAASGTNAVAA